MDLNQAIDNRKPFYIPERDNHKKILLMLMEAQNEAVVQATGLSLYDKNVEIDIKRNWTEKDCHRVVAFLSAKVINKLCTKHMPADSSILPYCLKHTNCVKCFYGTNYGKCKNPGSNYQQIISSIREKTGNSQISSILDFEMMLFNAWIGG